MWAKLAAFTLVLGAGCAQAQENGPSGFLRGELMGWSGTARAGQFTFRVSQDHVYFCSYDEKTYMERENQRISMAGAEKGDRVEVVSDQKQGSSLCYARTIHILEPPRAYVVPGVRPGLRKASVTTPLFPRMGDLTLTGAVLRVTPDALWLRLRSGEQKTIRLRPDTRYLTEGQTADPESLRVNTVVFVRAGKTIENQVEAYQVVWGDILQPMQ